MMKSSADRGSMAYVVLLTLVAALGGLLFGYDTAVISGAIGFLKTKFTLDPYWEGFVSASVLAGCAVGAGSAGFLNDRLGRKKVLLLAAIAFFASSVGTAMPQELASLVVGFTGGGADSDALWMFVFFRFLGGVGIGAASITSPMYIAEITPFRVRGRMVSVNQLAIVIGILLSFFVNYFINAYGDRQDKRAVEQYIQERGAAVPVETVRRFFADDARFVTPYVAWQLDEFEQRGTAGVSRDAFTEQTTAQARQKIDAFVNGQTEIASSQAVADYAAKVTLKEDGKQSAVTIDPTALDLLNQGKSSWNVELGWRWMFGSGVFPAVLFFLLLLGVAESPRWLTKQGRRDEAQAILTRVDGTTYAKNEIRSIEETIAQESGSLRQLFAPGMRGVLLLGIVLAVLQQVTGINAFLYFGPKIFGSLGSGVDAALLAQVVVGAVNVAFTIVAIGVVDRLGRKPLMLLGSAGMGLCLFGLGMAAFFKSVGVWALVFILGYIACFAMSVGPVVWVILAEIFPTRIRGRAMGLATVCLWLADYVVTQTFPMMNDNEWLINHFHRAFPFWGYAAFCVAMLLVVWRFVPETKGRTLEEIERSWAR